MIWRNSFSVRENFSFFHTVSCYQKYRSLKKLISRNILQIPLFQEIDFTKYFILKVKLWIFYTGKENKDHSTWFHGKIQVQIIEFFSHFCTVMTNTLAFWIWIQRKWDCVCDLIEIVQNNSLHVISISRKKVWFFFSLLCDFTFFFLIYIWKALDKSSRMHFT